MGDILPTYDIRAIRPSGLAVSRESGAAMPKSQRAQDFKIHVDPLCLTDFSDTKIPARGHGSDQPVMHSSVEDLNADEEESHGGSDSHRDSDSQGDSDSHEDNDSHGDNDSQRSSSISHDPHTQALIQAAARAVVASMEQEGYMAEDLGFESGDEDLGEGTELTYGADHAYDFTKASYESDGVDDPYDSVSSHHEDDVFSDHGQSHRSSLNSSDEHQTDEDACIRSEIGEAGLTMEHGQCDEVLSRMPSVCSNAYSLLPEPLNLVSSHPRTPTKVVSRPPFRSPSSVRALQMSSPTVSIFSSPRSSKQPTVSRLGTPHGRSPSKTKTPGRFKFKKEHPLVLLHVTVLPLQWQYSDTIDGFTGDGISRDLVSVKESWKLLQEKLGDTVLERGILLPHPQDSYELLEERLLQALELPVKPRARILTCGHYIGPGDMSSEEDSDSEGEGTSATGRDKERWCDICGREVMYEECKLGVKQRRFKIKVYASNGLMRSGAWAAAWREMERVDVELEPLVETAVGREIDQLLSRPPEPQLPESEPGMLDELCTAEEPKPKAEEADELRRRLSEERLREIYGSSHNLPPSPRMVSQARRQKHGDSLPELLLAALKVVMRDRRNVAIAILSLLVLVLALGPAKAAKAGVDVHEVLGEGAVLMSDMVDEVSVPLSGIVTDVEIEVDPATVLEEVPMPTTSDKVQSMIIEMPEMKTVLERAIQQEIQNLNSTEKDLEVEDADNQIGTGEQEAREVEF